MQEFIDPSYLSNKRPAIPGGAWSKSLLRKKSFADLQQLWFALVKEKNMLATTKHHYIVHQEELGAFPAPNRVDMVDKSMLNIKAIVQERDFEATDRAVALFRKRLRAGIYRYPPGPQPPASHGVESSRITVTFSKKVDTDRIRELFGRYDVFEEHKGISSISQNISVEAWRAKKKAEVSWNHYIKATRSHTGYHAFDGVNSVYDSSEAAIAPGVFREEESVRAVDVPVPDRPEIDDESLSVLESLKKSSQPAHLSKATNYSYYPIESTVAPDQPPERPIHPDEIEGPWVVTIDYDAPDGYGYAMGLEISAIDGAQVLKIQDRPTTRNYASRCPIYQEALRMADADEANTHEWPHVPTWKNAYSRYTRKGLGDIIMHNYSNVVDYVDREVLLTGKSSWEIPIKVDPSCGGGFNVPAHAKPNKEPLYRVSKFRKM